MPTPSAGPPRASTSRDKPKPAWSSDQALYGYAGLLTACEHLGLSPGQLIARARDHKAKPVVYDEVLRCHVRVARNRDPLAMPLRPRSDAA